MIRNKYRRIATGAVCVLLTVLLVLPLAGYAQLKPQPKKATPAPLPTPGVNPATLYSAIKLVEKSEYRQYIAVASACIKDKDWQDAVTALQTILDHKEDFYVQVRQRDPNGLETVRWTSVKFEANSLLGSMPEDGLNVYEVRYGGRAKDKLEEAKKNGDRELLADIAQRYMHTRAGAEANELLATYFLDRGQFFMSALRFERVLALNSERNKFGDLTLFKAALAYRRAGDTKNADALWKKLEPRLQASGGLKLGEDVIPAAKLQQILQEIPKPQALASLHDWPLIRGNLTNSAQAFGSPPLLDKDLWRRPLILDKDFDDPGEGKEADEWLKKALDNQARGPNNSVLPGFFPIAAGKLIVYRSYYGIRAVHLQEEKNEQGKVVAKPGDISWASTGFDGSLAPILDDNCPFQTMLKTWLGVYSKTSGFLNLVYENTLHGTLATDHHYVYAIDDLAIPCPPNTFQSVWSQPQGLPQELKSLILQNSLHAYDLRTGLFRFKLGEISSDKRKPNDPFNDSHFLGVPLAIGGKLYVLNEKHPGPTGDAELRLVVIEPTFTEPYTPKILHIQSLATVQSNHRITHDISRRINGVQMGFGEGILVCPTNAGEVLGIDILSRSLAWAYPYREQAPPRPAMINPNQFPGLGPQGQPINVALTNTANWKSAPPVIQDGKVVFTAPDANSVHCVNLRDGTPVWKKPQMEGDLYLGGVFGGKVLIVARNAVRALSLTDGSTIWYVATGDVPSGQGVASKNIYYLPLRRGEIVAIDIERGVIKAHNRATKAGTAPGNLIFYEGTVLSQTPREIIAYPQLTAMLNVAADALKADPSNPEKLIERGELLLADGQVQEAVGDLHKALANKPGEALEARAKNRLYDALTDLFQIDFDSASAKYLDEYRGLCKVAGNSEEEQQRQARFFRIVGQGREAQGKLVEAFGMYKDFGTLPIHKDGIAALDDPSHKVPSHVWLRGRIAGMIAKATPQQRRPLEQKIEEEWQVVKTKNNVEAVRAFVGMFDVPFAVGREARLQLAEAIMEGGERTAFLEAELNLQQLRSGAYRRDPNIGGRALAALARLEEKKSTSESMKLAASYYRALAREFPDKAVRDGKTGKELFNAMAEDRRFLPYLEEHGSLWRAGKIAARELASGNTGAPVQAFVLRPQGDLTPFSAQHRLVLEANQGGLSNPVIKLVDVSSNTIRWSQGLTSSETNSPFFQFLYQQAAANFAYFPNAHFRFFHVKGHLAVFQLGTTAYCLDLDNPRVLWQHSVFDANTAQSNLRIETVIPDSEGNPEMLLRNGLNGQMTRMRLGQVAAVQASYVALLTQKGLVVLDPLHGTPLWSKADIAPQTQVFGDDEHIYLVDSRGAGLAGAGRAVRAADGAPVEVKDFSFVYQNRLRPPGRILLAGVASKEGLTLRGYDIVLGKDLWKKSFNSAAVPLHTEDQRFTGVIEPDGKLIVLNAESGQELLRTNVLQGRVSTDDVKNLKEPLLLVDDDHWYVALNKAIDTNVISGGIISNNFKSGLRCHVVNGWFLALHRKEGKRHVGDEVRNWKQGDLHWHPLTPTLNQMIVLDQFEQLPLIVFTARYHEAAKAGVGSNRYVSITQSIDKRTGKVIWDSGPRGSNSTAYYDRFIVDTKAGTINMPGWAAMLQHYIEEGIEQKSEVRDQRSDLTSDL